MSISHVLFDFDGTLVNSIDRIIEVVEQVVQEHDPEKRINDTIKGMFAYWIEFIYLFVSCLPDYVPNLTSFQNLFTLINTELNLALDPNHYAAFVGREARTNLQFLPGVEKLVKHLHSHNIPMAVATGAGRQNYEVGRSNFSDFFDTYISHAVCAFDDPEVKNRKPAPDCYHVASAKFVQPPTDMGKVLIFEDSITGLKGATASGGRTVFVSKWKSMFAEHNQPHIEKAELILETMEHFKPEHFGLPPYNDQ